MSGKAWRKPKANQLDRNGRKFPHQTHSYILDTNWFLALKTLQALHEAMLPNQLTILHEAAHKGQDPTEEGQLYIPVGGYQSMKHVEHVHGGKFWASSKSMNPSAWGFSQGILQPTLSLIHSSQQHVPTQLREVVIPTNWTGHSA